VKKCVLTNALDNFSLLCVRQIKAIQQQSVIKTNQLAGCLVYNEFVFKLAYLRDIFAKLNKLIISMQEPDENML